MSPITLLYHRREFFSNRWLGFSRTDWLISVYFSDLNWIVSPTSPIPVRLYFDVDIDYNSFVLVLSRVAWPSSQTSREFPRLLMPLYFIHTPSSRVHHLCHLSRCLHHGLAVVIFWSHVKSVWSIDLHHGLAVIIFDLVCGTSLISSLCVPPWDPIERS